MRFTAMVFLVSLGLALAPAESRPAPTVNRVSTATLTIPTYPYADFLQTRHSDAYNMDYLWLDWAAYDASNPQPSPHDYTAVVVENPWLRLTFLPELGGRLYGVTVKADGEELLYQNPVIKPTHWGPEEQGWWLAAGGIEWCLPVEEHGYEWGIPWGYATSITTEGTTVTLWDTLAADRIRSSIRVALPTDRAALQITPRLENPTAAPVSFKFWDNAMLAPGAPNTVGPDLRFVLPISQVTVHSRGDDYLPGPGEAMDWPVHAGTDYSRLGNWNRWLGLFARPQAAEDWAGVYDEGAERGLARVFPHQIAVGVKGFGFGWNDPIPSTVWTDDGSYYVELHGGPAPTFWDTITLNPGESLEWTETWLPLHGLPALSLATEDLALGIKSEGEDLRLGLWVAGQHNGLSARLWLKSDCTLLWQQDGLNLSPGDAYAHTIAGLGLGTDQVVFGVLEGGRLLVATGRLACPPPASQVNALDTVQTTTAFPVTWSGTDNGAGVESYDIQVRDGEVEAPWMPWLTATTATSALFAGVDGHTYTFRSRACDAFGNEEEWPTNGWQDTFTTILLEPAPVLITSDKVAHPLWLHPGDLVEFQIRLNNTGNLAAGVQVTDPLPANLALTSDPWSTLPPDPTFDGSAIAWNGNLDPGQTDVAIGFEAQVLVLRPGGVVTNVAWIDDGVHPTLRRQVTIEGRLCVYLPLVLKSAFR